MKRKGMIIMKIDNIDPQELNIPSWNATYILRPDMVTMAASLGEYGLLTPLVVQESTNVVIDGSQRLKVIQGNKIIAKKIGASVPIRFVDCDELDAMILHIQLNRGRGSMVAKQVSNIVKKLNRSKRLAEADFERLFCMKYDELELMLDGTIIKHRDIQNYNYSRAWVPVEAPSNTVEEGGISIERPPNQDR